MELLKNNRCNLTPKFVQIYFLIGGLTSTVNGGCNRKFTCRGGGCVSFHSSDRVIPSILRSSDQSMQFLMIDVLSVLQNVSSIICSLEHYTSSVHYAVHLLL
jgi:hypothetical protein